MKCALLFAKAQTSTYHVVVVADRADVGRAALGDAAERGCASPANRARGRGVDHLPRGALRLRDLGATCRADQSADALALRVALVVRGEGVAVIARSARAVHDASARAAVRRSARRGGVAREVGVGDRAGSRARVLAGLVAARGRDAAPVCVSGRGEGKVSDIIRNPHNGVPHGEGGTVDWSVI